MRRHTLNLFKIRNLAELNFSYKLVSFELPAIADKEDLFNKQLKQIALAVSSLSEGPSAVIKRDGRFYVAIPADKTMLDAKVDVTAFSVNVTLLPEVYLINGAAIPEDQKDVVYKFLEFEIKRQLLMNFPLWRLNNSHFYNKTPVEGREDSNIQIFEGFKWKLKHHRDGNIYIVLDISTKYVDRHTLSYYINSQNVQQLTRQFKKRRAVYSNGENWYMAEIVGFGPAIADHEVTLDNQTYSVYDYIMQKVRSRVNLKQFVKKNDLTLFYQYPGRKMEPHSGATSLARMLYNTKDKDVKSLHRQSIKIPSERFEKITDLVRKYFSNLTFQGKDLRVAMYAATQQVASFPMPSFKFNGNKILDVNENPETKESALRNLGRNRKKMIMDNGILNQKGFDPQYLIVPDYLEKNLVQGFQTNLEFMIKKLAPNFGQFKIITYKVNDSLSATYQIDSIAEELHRNQAKKGFALFVLPDTSFNQRKKASDFHDILKTKFYPDLKIQCASAYKMSSFFRAYPKKDALPAEMEYRVPEGDRQKFSNYLLNLVLEYFIVNRKWPYALGTNLNYDIYVGIDVKDRFAGFTFFIRNGEHLYFKSYQVPKKMKSIRAEKIKEDQLNKILYENLKLMIPNFAQNPNGIVIVRDGQSSDEGKALAQVIKQLKAEQIINEEIPYAVVDMHKQIATPVRMGLLTDGFHKIENPVAGTYWMSDDNEGYLFNTGSPFENPGTVKPLNLIFKEGTLDFTKIMEDMFRQTMLAFSAPDRNNSLPICIKLIDVLLEPLSDVHESQDEEEEDEFEDILDD
ncbi:hypothetical protein [Mucilaginibacter sp. L3T2-6]|uniref:hypothetical protein n=1 Tax=Mucilaginibacter sp. L3T2-6 TaxID=3062491 RepID=UPI002676BC47|nr:hypothetical protein [Mucilaginibacter sp. L3T2-6]MDO3641501.1 hypothetical protein [Mucilaginibacter sp. L3T2-6]MDV6213738.1 hypothetical protein [Mucilaginibacter sp. L3T2-6]